MYDTKGIQLLFVLILIRENVFISLINILYKPSQHPVIKLSTAYLGAKKVKGGEIPFLCVGCVVCQYCFLQRRIGNTSKT